MSADTVMTMTIWRVGWLWGPVVSVMGGIFFLSSLSDIPAPPGGMSDIGAHALAYATLGVTMARALVSTLDRGRVMTLTTMAVAVGLTVAYGLTDELHQWFVPGRTAEWRDVAADLVGAVAGVGLAWAWGIVFSSRVVDSSLPKRHGVHEHPARTDGRGFGGDRQPSAGAQRPRCGDD